MVNPPANTASRRNRICSCPVSNAWLHSMVLRSVRWCGRAVLLPDVSNPNTSSSRAAICWGRSEEHTSELQSQSNLVCRLLLEKKKTNDKHHKQSVRQS